MNKITAVLKEFGLHEKEITVYLESLKHEETGPYEIARNTGIPRTSVYDILMNLSLKGIIELNQSQGFEKQQTRIKAKNPSILREILRKKRESLVNLEVDVVDILADLKGDYLQHRNTDIMQFYPGIEGARKVMEMTIEPPDCSTVYMWDSLIPQDSIGRKASNSLVDRDIKWSKKHTNHFKVLIAWNMWTQHVITYTYQRVPNYFKNMEHRYIDVPGFNLHQDITIVGNTVKITCAKEDEAWGMTLTSKLYAKTLKSMFELQWHSARELNEELIKSYLPNDYLQAEQKKYSDK